MTLPPPFSKREITFSGIPAHFIQSVQKCTKIGGPVRVTYGSNGTTGKATNFGTPSNGFMLYTNMPSDEKERREKKDL